MPIGGSVGSVFDDAKCVAGRMNPRCVCAERHPDRMADRAAGHLVVAHQAGQDRQTGRVGTGPRRAGAARRSSGSTARPTYAAQPSPLRPRHKQLEQLARALLQHQHVAVAAALRAAFDRRVERHRVRPRVALVGVHGEVDRHQRLIGRDDDVGDAVVGVLAEVGVQVVAADRLDLVDDLRSTRMQRVAADVGVPGVACRGRSSSRRSTGRAA